MKICISDWCFHPLIEKGKMTMEDVAKICKKLGVDGVELSQQHFTDTSDRYLESLRRKIESLGIEVAAVDTIYFHEFLTPEKAEKGVEGVKKWIEIASKLNSKILRIYSDVPQPGKTIEETFELVKRCYKECIPHAQKYGVTLVVEQGHTFDALEDPASVAALVRVVDSKNVRMLFDFQHSGAMLGQFGWFKYGVFRLVGSVVSYVHLGTFGHDERGEDLYTDVGKMILTMKEIGYDGYINIEYKGKRETLEECMNVVEKSLSLLRKHM